MLETYQYSKFETVLTQEQATGAVRRHSVVIVGAGPVGLTAALDCARRGIRAMVFDDNDTVSVGSRAVCYAKRPLEIWDRLGCGKEMVAKGVDWQVGKVFFGDELSYSFDLLPENGHKMPAMINLQQYYLEEYLIAACQDHDNLISLHFNHKVISMRQVTTGSDPHVALTIETPEGIFSTQCDWLLACDGANSDIRKMVGAEFTGQFFQDRFLIADVVTQADFPPERWFWFDPHFHRGQSALLHRQPDNVWRLDFQLGWDADPAVEMRSENIIQRVKAMLGQDQEFELEWASIYQFACRRVDQFRHGRVLFAGDSAHQVSPFGARGANTGVQDVDNLIWKLQLVLNGQAPESLIDTYHEERAFAADENLLNSTRSTDFISPKTRSSRFFRDAVLELARDHEFARPLVNSGRLSMPTPYVGSSLNSHSPDTFESSMRPGTNCSDAPIKMQGANRWLLDLLGDGFVVLHFGEPPEISEIGAGKVKAQILSISTYEGVDLLRQRYDGLAGTTYLIRPDQHIAARWRQFDPLAIQAALATAAGLQSEGVQT